MHGNVQWAHRVPPHVSPISTATLSAETSLWSTQTGYAPCSWQFLAVFDSYAYRPYAVYMSSDIQLTSMTVSLPTTLKDYVKTQSISAGCSTPSEYIRRLIHADKTANEQQALERKVLEGLASPKSKMGPTEWQDLRATLRNTLGKPAEDH